MPNNQELLKSVPLFARLPEKTLDRLDRILVERQYAPGAEIVHEGDMAAGFFLIMDGRVDILRGDGPSPVASLTKGAYFGEMALLDGRPRSATVRAAEQTRCLAMPRWDFLAEVKSNPDIAVELLETLSLRVRDLEQRLEALQKRVRELEQRQPA